MAISLTYLKQERDVADRILDNLSYAAKKETLEIELRIFRGKHFRHLSVEQLLKRIEEISRNFKNENLIDDFSIEDHKGVSEDLLIVFDLRDKVESLISYRRELNNKIRKLELNDAMKRGNYCRLDDDTCTFYYTLPNGSVQTIPLFAQRGSKKMYLIFKVLYNSWIKAAGEVVPKYILISELGKLGWDDVNDADLKNYIGNIRKTKIIPAKLSKYVSIISDRKHKGYRLEIIYH